MKNDSQRQKSGGKYVIDEKPPQTKPYAPYKRTTTDSGHSYRHCALQALSHVLSRSNRRTRTMSERLENLKALDSFADYTLSKRRVVP